MDMLYDLLLFLLILVVRVFVFFSHVTCFVISQDPESKSVLVQIIRAKSVLVDDSPNEVVPACKMRRFPGFTSWTDHSQEVDKLQQQNRQESLPLNPPNHPLPLRWIKDHLVDAWDEGELKVY